MRTQTEMAARKIRFRGRRADGKWLYGDLVHNRGKVYIADDTIVDGNDIKGHTDFEVDPETIGQYIGKTDDNTPLYTGDIVSFSVKSKIMKGVIEYSENIAGYCVRLIIDEKRTDIFTAIQRHCLIMDCKRYEPRNQTETDFLFRKKNSKAIKSQKTGE